MASNSNRTNPQTDYLRALFSTARRRPGFWIVPLAAAGLIALLVGFLGPKQWQANQSFVVREELIGRIVGPGRFDSLDAMKTAQETIQEIARKPEVLRCTLMIVGPASGTTGSDWPSDETIEDIQGSIGFFAPNGAEFGKTEILTLSSKSSSRNRARQIAEALFEELQIELRNVRQQRANSMVQEIQQAVSLTQTRLRVTTERLTEMESAVGADLAELRNLTRENPGNSELGQMYTQIQAEIREAKSQLAAQQQQRDQLAAAIENPAAIIATPQALPTPLAQLKEKLIDAQANRATVGARFSPKHPAHKAAENAYADLQQEISRELSNAIGGLDSQLMIAQTRFDSLNEKAQTINQRMDELANMRLEYGTVLVEHQQRSKDLTESFKELAQAESIHSAAGNVNLISPLGDVQAATNPLGPGKKTMLLGALIAGGLIGIGLVMMVTPSEPLGQGPSGRPQDSRPLPPTANQPTGQTPIQVPTTSTTYVLPDINPTFADPGSPSPLA